MTRNGEANTKKDNTKAAVNQPDVRVLSLQVLYESPTNPRKNFDKAGLEELRRSIQEKGILNPLLVRPRPGDATGTDFEIVAGARRWRAAKAAKFSDVPVYVRELSDQETIEIQVVENLQREDVHPLEEAEAYAKLIGEGRDFSALANKLGKSERYIRERMSLNNLTDKLKKLFRDGKTSLGHVRLVARLTPEEQKEATKWIERGDSVGGLRQEIERYFFLTLRDAPFDLAVANYVPTAGSCVDCPKRTGFNALLFADVKEQDTCTDPKCYKSKVAAFVQIKVRENPEAVKLTVGSTYNQKPSGLTDWTVAGDKECPDTKAGVVVEILGYMDASRKAAVGISLKVCVNPKCKIHNIAVRHNDDSGYAKQVAQSRKAERVRKIELRRRGMVFKQIAALKFTITPADRRAMLDWATGTLSSDHARAFCNAMELDPPSGKYINKDYREGVKKALAKIPGVAADKWIYLLMLIQTDVWFYSGHTAKAKLLDAKASALHVPLALIAKLAKEKTAKPKAKAKK